MKAILVSAMILGSVSFAHAADYDRSGHHRDCMSSLGVIRNHETKWGFTAIVSRRGHSCQSMRRPLRCEDGRLVGQKDLFPRCRDWGKKFTEEEQLLTSEE